MSDRSFDVVVAGGGLAGSSLGGVLARSGLGVLVVEKETEFRDRIRGELAFPWGHYEALRAELGEPLAQVGVVPLPTMDFYHEGHKVDSQRWEEISLDGLPAVGFSHPELQEVMLTWAEAQGATVVRPAKVVGVDDGDSTSVSVVKDGRTTEYHARLTVGADGKKSSARRWVKAKTEVDPEHHRFGGLLLSDVTWEETFGWAATPPSAVGWLAAGAEACRVYIRLTADRIRETGVGRSVEAFIAFASEAMPDGALERAQPVGPLGFFANSCTWPTSIARDNLVLIGDAAGSLDPSQGLGTSLLFRDVRALSELLLADDDWQSATSEFARQRQGYYEVLRAYDRWSTLLEAEVGPDADRQRERHAAAREADPALGGFALLEARGPDGLVPDETARRIYFGE